MDWIDEHIKCNILTLNVTLILSYRGYVDSEGSPSESGIFIDTKAALDFIQTNKDNLEYYQNPDIILFGESIGCAVALKLASIYPK